MKKYNYYWIGLFIGLMLLILSWGYDFYQNRLPTIDIWSRDLAEHFGDTRYYDAFLLITHLGSKSFLIPFTIAMMIVLYFLYKEWITPVMLGIGTLLGWQTNHFIKLIIQRERPSILEAASGVGYSFPSGHAMISFIFYSLLAYFLIKKLHSKRLSFFIMLITGILILLIGISRYFINVHYITDIVAGYWFGWIFVLIWIKFYHWLAKRKLF